jgi:hypothetical protein
MEEEKLEELMMNIREYNPNYVEGTKKIKKSIKQIWKNKDKDIWRKC